MSRTKRESLSGSFSRSISKLQRPASAGLLAAAAFALGACGGDGGGTGTPNLKWYTTCGDPVCGASGWMPKTGIPLCTTEKAGDACTTASSKCDPKDSCNAVLSCVTADPKGMCPISKRAYKTEISYLDQAGLQRYADELTRVRLATYRYKTGGPTRLGFIIDDLPGAEPQGPESAARVSVDAAGEHVDLYGYTSMAVAAVKLQEQKIAALEAELRELKQLVAQQARPARPASAQRSRAH